MSLVFGPKRTFSTGTEWGLTTDGDIVWRGFSSGTDIKVDILNGQGFALSSTVTVNTNAANNDVMLNEPFCRDLVTGRLHLCFGRSVDTGSKAVLMHSSSNDAGATWDASPHTLDDGTTHTGTNSFYRVGIAAYNGYVSCWYTYESSSTFTTDGLWEVHSADAGATWSAPTKQYTSTVVGPYEPNIAIGDDATAHISWYDPGVVSNQGGAVYYVRGTFNGTGWTWSGSPAIIAPLSEVWGRTRIFCSNGVVMVIGNTTWGGSVADVGLIRSADNGITWGSTVTVATHGAGPLDHPWGVIDSEKAALCWADLSTSPLKYGMVLSTDAGTTWGASFEPITQTGTSDAVKLVITNDLLSLWGYDNNAGLGLKAAYPWFSPDPAVTASIDAFNRANENPLSDGGKWTKFPDAGNNLKLVSNQVTRQLGAGSFDRSGSYRNDITTSGYYEAYLDVVTAGGEVDIIIEDTSQNGYNFAFSNGDFGTVAAINKIVATATTTIDSVTFTLTAGDQMALRLDLNDVVALVKRGGNWQEVCRATDTTFRNNLRLATDIAGIAGTPVIDNFGGGQLFAPVNNTLPIVSGTYGNGQTITASYGTWATDLGKTPTRFRFQWQSSAVGGGAWSDITRATNKFYVITDATKWYRVKVTGYNSIGSTIATSGSFQAISLFNGLLTSSRLTGVGG